SRPSVYDDARRGEAELQDDHQRDEGCLPGRPAHSRGVPSPVDDQRGPRLKLEALAGRSVLVTGASRGIGKATAELLASEGAWVGMVARSETALRDAAARCGGHALPADVSSSTSV